MQYRAWSPMLDSSARLSLCSQKHMNEHTNRHMQEMLQKCTGAYLKQVHSYLTRLLQDVANTAAGVQRVTVRALLRVHNAL
jgi:hypothetical protein